MKAAVYRKRGPERVVIEDMPKPVPGDNEVLVKVYASSANAGDYRSMSMGILRDGRVMGSDIAGRVEAVGRGVKRFRQGDAVFGDIFKSGGGCAEYAAVREHMLALIPEGVSFEQAAALPIAGITALQALRYKGGIKRGQSILICGAGGGVGTYAVQLAKEFGAHVTAVCGAGNAALVRELGADRVINYATEDFFGGEEKYDMIAAINGKHKLSAYRRALKRGGTLVVVGGALSQIFKTMLFGRFMRGIKTGVLEAKANAQDLEYLARLVREGNMRSVIDRRYTLEETATAVKYLAGGHAHGKVIITVREEN